MAKRMVMKQHEYQEVCINEGFCNVDELWGTEVGKADCTRLVCRYK